MFEHGHHQNVFDELTRGDSRTESGSVEMQPKDTDIEERHPLLRAMIPLPPCITTCGEATPHPQPIRAQLSMRRIGSSQACSAEATPVNCGMVVLRRARGRPAARGNFVFSHASIPPPNLAVMFG